MSVRLIPIYPENLVTFERNRIFLALKRDMISYEILCPTFFLAHCASLMSRRPILREMGEVRSWDRAQFRFVSSCPFGGWVSARTAYSVIQNFVFFNRPRDSLISTQWGPHCATPAPPTLGVPHCHDVRGVSMGFRGTPTWDALHTEKSFRILIISNRNQIVFTIFRLFWNQTDVRYNLISVWF